MDFEVTIVGAGPYGLSSAAYLRDKGIPIAVFGGPMHFWQNHMPEGMFLRSHWTACHIAHPRGKLTLDDFKAETGAQFDKPVPLQNFIQYGIWYQKAVIPDLRQCDVSCVESRSPGFEVTLCDGQVVKSKRVIVATGIAPFPWVPREFEGLPKSHVTHSSDHSQLSRFKGQKVVVIGGGQSALDSARLLRALDVEVEVVTRQKTIRWVGEHVWLHRLGFISWCLYSQYDVGPAGLSRLVGFPNVFRMLPRDLQNTLSDRATRPAGTGWQRPYLAQVPITLDCEVKSAEIVGDQILLKLSNGATRLVDHVILATGYRVDTSRYNFLSPSIRKSLRTEQGYPVLGRGLESSVAGLHFVGKPAAWSFGPLLNFVSGCHFAGPELLRALC